MHSTVPCRHVWSLCLHEVSACADGNPVTCAGETAWQHGGSGQWLANGMALVAERQGCIMTTQQNSRSRSTSDAKASSSRPTLQAVDRGDSKRAATCLAAPVAIAVDVESRRTQLEALLHVRPDYTFARADASSATAAVAECKRPRCMGVGADYMRGSAMQSAAEIRQGVMTALSTYQSGKPEVYHSLRQILMQMLCLRVQVGILFDGVVYLMIRLRCVDSDAGYVSSTDDLLESHTWRASFKSSCILTTAPTPCTPACGGHLGTC